MPLTDHPATDVYDGWRLAVQAWSFNRFTFYEAVDKVAELGLSWIEAYPGQRLSPTHPEAQFHHTMDAATREQVKKKLASCGVRVINYGVVGLPNDEKECRKVFDFAQDMGIKTIVSEPPEDAFELIDQLCQEYKIKVAVHNHPEPSHYWNPETVLKVTKGRSAWIGACADTGHWMRSGVNPLGALKMLKGRIVSLHLKDLNEFAVREAHDVVWGTGKANMEGLLKELDQQSFKGVFSIEYEYNWDNSLPDIRRCVAYFNKTAAPMKPTGWKDLFAADLSNAEFKPDSWTLAEGVLTRKGGGDLGTKDKYGNFILDAGFKVAQDSNSGIILRMGDRNWIPWPEVQIFDSHGKTPPDRHDCGGIFDIIAPTKNTVNPPGQWNRITIATQDSKISVVLNGVRVVDMDLDRWTEPNKNPDGSKNKFDIAYKDLPRVGFIALQDHGQDVWYRNIKIKTLE